MTSTPNSAPVIPHQKQSIQIRSRNAKCILLDAFFFVNKTQFKKALFKAKRSLQNNTEMSTLSKSGAA
jgi:hypothetical protein